jgi:hypothetical protein
MISELRHSWQEMQATFRFVPALIVLGAVGLIAIDARTELHVDQTLPLLFGAAGSRGRSRPSPP